ncbi:MAG: ATP synthase F1 subunit epsilon [Solobacterium sp.]|jgi:F-type H+-transporting ATPase subunit epsilon|nr:ATP synthase F1 subunit epsilon [Solobacterium sp.]MCH4227895.1 ATP synthase F1 subunit epsilon [Solobacterium sp.]MCH4283282.1 ATP synthase F1 subunit epsilon [Solobacterium sp.]NLH63577.1 ATP synthase F1 subunit epsilon [Erysipelotrichaceae bacterium]
MSIHCRIITPQGVYKEMDANIINIDTTEGQEGILPNHLPVVTMLKIGRITADENGTRQEYAVAGGLFYFRDNKAEILTDAIENKEDIDIDRAEQAKKRAEDRLQSNDPSVDQKRAELALKKAMNRIKTKNIKQ